MCCQIGSYSLYIHLYMEIIYPMCLVQQYHQKLIRIRIEKFLLPLLFENRKFHQFFHYKNRILLRVDCNSSTFGPVEPNFNISIIFSSFLSWSFIRVMLPFKRYLLSDILFKQMKNCDKFWSEVNKKKLVDILCTITIS